MASSLIYMLKENKFTTNEVVHNLQHANDSKFSSMAALNPQAGQVYMYNEKPFTFDNYRWTHCGKHSMPKDKPSIVKTYYRRNICGSEKNLCRDVYALTTTNVPSPTLVHYHEQNVESMPKQQSRINKTKVG